MKKKYITPLINIEDIVIEDTMLAGSDPNVKNQGFGNQDSGTSTDYSSTVEGDEGDDIITLGKESWNCWDDEEDDIF